MFLEHQLLALGYQLPYQTMSTHMFSQSFVTHTHSYLPNIILNKEQHVDKSSLPLSGSLTPAQYIHHAMTYMLSQLC